MGVGDRLSAITEEMGKIKTEIAILTEQAMFASNVASDANLRAVVSETPLADREYAEAQRDFEIAQRVLNDAKARLLALQQEQDRLLERMFEESSSDG